MLLFIEGYPYNLNDTVRDNLTVRDVLKDVVSIPVKEDQYSFGYVGYCYSKAAKDVIFFLPKVVLTGEQNEESGDDTIFGASPQEIIDFESEKIKSKFTEEGCKEYKEFLSTLSIWVYRTISVYKQTHNDNILESKDYQTESRGRKQKHNTLLDVIIALRDFNRNNQDYFTFIAKNVHSGYNRINWNKTIASSQAFIQNGTPVYVEPVNRKKMVNFDEELLVIYFSILNYICETHGFSFEINIHYQLISPEKLKNTYIKKNLGCRRLKQIKYKYFSDKALRIWDLCYAFFDREYKISMNRQAEDFLLAKDFDHIFEVMIDTLVGGNDKQELPKELTEQKDGKLVDHMFIGQGLIEQSDLPADLTYYIGDSKYYKRSKNDRTLLGEKSVYKQYTYARNVIQWNMNLFLDGDGIGEHPQLRDTLTEGYNPIPNFFISARIPNRRSGGARFLSFDDKELKSQEGGVQLNRQFENRLFDRDTLLLCHYDVNFLYIVSLYGRNNKSSQTAWREYVRKEFRSKIQDTLNRLYTFRTLQPRDGMDCYQFIQDNFPLLYVQRGVKLTNTSNGRSTDIRTQSIDIPIELKWEMGISDDFDLFLGAGPSFSFLVDEDNWGRKLAHIAVDAIDKDLSSMGWRSTEVGLNLGGGVKIVKHLMVSCYYNIGLTQSAKHNIGGNKHDVIDQIFDGDVFESKNRY